MTTEQYTRFGRKEYKMDARMFTQNTAKINGRRVNHYLVDTDIGQINIVQYEKPTMEIVTEIIFNDWDKAEKKFNTICKKILDCRL